MKAEVQLLQTGQIGDGLELVIRIQLAAGVGIPLRPG